MADTTTLTIEITTGHCLGGEGNDVYAGKILMAPQDLSIADARKKIRLGYARIVPEAPEGTLDTLGPESPTSGPAIVTDGDPTPDSRDPVLESQNDHTGRPHGPRTLRAGERR